jgi:hypothetical protein
MNQHRTSTIGLAAALMLTTTALIGAAGAGQASPQSWRGAIAQGNVIEIKGVNGSVRALASSGAEVEVSAVMKGRRNNPAEVRLEIAQHADGVTICAMYPSPDSRPNECAPGDGGRMNVRDNDVTVDFTVRVPAGIRFSGRTVNGDVTAESMTGPVAIRTVNGDVEFSTSSYGEAHTVNGSIRGSMGSTGWNDALTFKSVNGSVQVTLPGDASTDVKVTTVNGSISTAFPISVSGRVDPRRLSGTIGSGGRSLEIETVNGSVTLRRQN